MCRRSCCWWLALLLPPCHRLHKRAQTEAHPLLHVDAAAAGWLVAQPGHCSPAHLLQVTDAARSAEAVKKAAEAGEVLATVGQVRFLCRCCLMQMRILGRGAVHLWL